MIKRIVRQGLLSVMILAGVFSAFAQKEKPPQGGQPKPFIFPKTENYTLPNGMRVTLVPYGSVPKVAIRLYINAGSLNEPEGKRWVSDAVAVSLKDGTLTRTGEQIAREMAEMGGSVNTGAGTDITTIGGEVLSEFDVRFIEMIADLALNPKFAESDLEQYRNNKLRELKLAETQAGSVAWSKFRSAVFPGHPYGEIQPTEETVKGYSVSDLKSFHSENYAAARSHLYVCGKFNPIAVKTAVAKVFGKMKKGSAASRNIPVPSSKRTLSVFDRPGAPQSTIYLGMPAISQSDPDYVKFSVMDSILGGAFSSRITANIREDKGYTYSPGSAVWIRYKVGMWYESADVTTEATGASIKEILYEINRMKTELVPEAELQGIKNNTVGIYVLQNSSRFGVIGQLQSLDYNELDKTYLDNYLKSVVAVTAKDVQDMAKKYLSEDKMTIVVVGDKSKIMDQLKPYQK